MRAEDGRARNTTPKATPAAPRLAGILDDLSDRQRTYLLTVYDEDQRREAA